MKTNEIKFKFADQCYSVIIGKNVIGLLPKKIKILCPKTRKIALIIDKNIPNKFRTILKKNYLITIYFFIHLQQMKKQKLLKQLTFFRKIER